MDDLVHRHRNDSYLETQRKGIGGDHAEFLDSTGSLVFIWGISIWKPCYDGWSLVLRHRIDSYLETQRKGVGGWWIGLVKMWKSFKIKMDSFSLPKIPSPGGTNCSFPRNYTARLVWAQTEWKFGVLLFRLFVMLNHYSSVKFITSIVHCTLILTK